MHYSIPATIARNFAGLDAPESVGRIAAERALRRLGAVKVETQRVPVIFEPRTARSLLGNLSDAVEGRDLLDCDGPLPAPTFLSPLAGSTLLKRARTCDLSCGNIMVS